MSTRWMRGVLRMAPRAFRQKYTDELLATYAERERAARARGRCGAFRLQELCGALLLVVRLRLGIEGDSGWSDERRSEGSWIAPTWQDARYAARTLLRSRGFTFAAVVVLGLGIGATSAIVSAVNAYFFRPLPFTEPDRLVTVFETNPEFGWDSESLPASRR